MDVKNSLQAEAFTPLQTQVSSGRGLRRFSTEGKKKKRKDLQLQFEPIPEVSSSALSQLSPMFGRSSALSLAAGLCRSV